MRTLMMVSIILLLSQQATAEEMQQQGRYQIIFSSHVRADKYLLDTWTGKVWQNVRFVDMEDEPSVWEVMDQIDGREDYLEWRKHHLSKKEAAAFEKLSKEATP